MKRQSKAPDPDRIIEAVEFVKREAALYGAVIPMNNREYWALVGTDFMQFFSRNLSGESKRYAWTTITVDDLRNLKIWRRA